MKYAVALRFMLLKETSYLREFLYVMPYLLQHIGRYEFSFLVESVDLQTETDIIMTLDIQPPPLTGFEAESTTLGVTDPEEARTTAALMLWIASIRRIGDSPLKRAWAVFCEHRNLPYGLPPVALNGYLFKRLPPLPKVDLVPHLTISEYDGSQATPA
jgi:hypothetical protein